MQCYPALLFLLVPDADDLYRAIIILSDHDVDREMPFTGSMRSDSFEEARRLLLIGRYVLQSIQPRSHQAEAFAKTHGNMVKHPGSEFCHLTDRPFKQAVVNNKSIDLVVP